VSVEEFESRVLPALLDTASTISANLLGRPPSEGAVDSPPAPHGPGIRPQERQREPTANAAGTRS
jgi:hypothetical protein